MCIYVPIHTATGVASRVYSIVSVECEILMQNVRVRAMLGSGLGQGSVRDRV